MRPWLSVETKNIENELLYFIMLYYIVLCFTILYCIVRYLTVLYYSVLYFTLLYCTVLYSTLPYCNVLYYILSPVDDYFLPQQSLICAMLYFYLYLQGCYIL